MAKSSRANPGTIRRSACSRCAAPRRNDDGTVPILTLFLNPSEQDRVFRLPTQNVPTRLLLDSADPAKPESDIAGEEITVAARSAVLTKSVFRPTPP